MKEQQKKYKINKKSLIIVFIISFSLALILTCWDFIKFGVQYAYSKTWEDYKFEEYNLEFSLPRAYKVVEKEEDTTYKIGSLLLSTTADISGDNINYLAKSQRVYSGGNVYTGISIAVNALKTSKTTKPLEEVAESYSVLIPYFYQDDYDSNGYSIENLSKDGVDIMQVSCDLQNDEENKTVVLYLMSFDEKEVTVTFFGNTEKVNSEIENLQKIISKVK